MRTSGAAGYAPEGFVPYEAVPPRDVKMLSQYFREAGYYTSNHAKEDYQFAAPDAAWDDSSIGAQWRASETDSQLISFVDFKSTLLSLVNIEPPSYTDGRAFLGEFKTKPRQYFHAAADRFDSEYDMIRAMGDVR